jgi:hypothetical protein
MTLNIMTPDSHAANGGYQSFLVLFSQLRIEHRFDAFRRRPRKDVLNI